MLNITAKPENHQLNAQLKILVIDDEKSFTDEIKEFLQNQGYISFIANNIHKGRAFLKNEDIDLLILDVRLKGISGLDILIEVKQNYPNVEVIIVSAHGDMDTDTLIFTLQFTKPGNFLIFNVLSKIWRKKPLLFLNHFKTE
jgi:DNA-binding response OmpR family regulator